MQVPIDRPTRRTSHAGRRWRLGAALLVALLMVFGQLTQQVAASPLTEPGPYDFSVSISGPAPLAEYDDATYTAVPANGTGPYTYTWFRNGTQVGTGATYSVHLVRSSFTLQVNAVDAYGSPASDSLSVYVVPECRRC